VTRHPSGAGQAILAVRGIGADALEAQKILPFRNKSLVIGGVVLLKLFHEMPVKRLQSPHSATDGSALEEIL
jgi:hypothetical protein